LLNDIPGLRFSLRLAAGLLPTPELSNRRKNFVTIQCCPLCCRNVNYEDKPLFNSCKSPDELNKMTKDLIEDTVKHYFKISQKGGEPYLLLESYRLTKTL
jgi:organic radical activating enzyme